ncbi:MAG TPA: YihY/virulence factor BrkB family protein [Phototrophicaceae bacterium]|nr:YihY/virulence factor BrkB family protein [Phototrophicaceae bacterium]
MDRVKAFLALLKTAFDEWNKDNAPRLAAALSYYTIFSIAPLLIVVVAIAGAVWGPEAVQGRLDEQIQGMIGAQGADLVQQMVQNARHPADNLIATLIGLATLLLGAAGLFVQLKGALNTVWEVQPPPQGIWGTIKTQLLSFTMVLGVGFLLLVSLVISAVIAALSNFINGMIGNVEFVLQLLNFAISFSFITLLFALIYKFLPDIKIEWRDVWIGAAFTSLLFTIGKTLIGLYLGNSGVTSTYGAAGSLVIVLLWVYYSAQILLFGAEFTQVYARKYGSNPQLSAQPEVETSAAAVPVMKPAAHPGYPLPYEDETPPSPAENRAVALPLIAVEAQTAAESHPTLDTTRYRLSQRIFAAASLLATFLSFIAGRLFRSRRSDRLV